MARRVPRRTLTTVWVPACRVYMHLTNYSLNKHNSKKYVHADYDSEDFSDTESASDADSVGSPAPAVDAAPGGDGLTPAGAERAAEPPPNAAGAGGGEAAAASGTAPPSTSRTGEPGQRRAKPAFIGQATSVINDDGASKRTLSAVLKQLAASGVDVNSTWRAIQGMCARTVIALQDQLQHHLMNTLGKKRTRHKTCPCFHILGCASVASCPPASHAWVSPDALCFCRGASG